MTPLRSDDALSARTKGSMPSGGQPNRGQVNAVHVSSFSRKLVIFGNRAKYVNASTCDHVAHSLFLFCFGLTSASTKIGCQDVPRLF